MFLCHEFSCIYIYICMSNRDGIDALAKKSENENNYIQYQSKIFPKLSAEDMLKNNVHFVTLKAVSVTIGP